MRFKYSTLNPTQPESESLPRLPLTLSLNVQQVECLGLVDSGATVNVMPYEMGRQLGAAWESSKARIRLGGNLGAYPAMPLFVTAAVASFPAVRLAFAWAQSNDAPLILGEMNFFLEFDVCFYRARYEFEVNPK